MSLIFRVDEFFYRSRYDSLLIEYARYLPFGLAVASTFLQDLHDAHTERVISEMNLERTLRDIFDRGGETVDEELRSLVIDIYNLHEQLNLNLERM